MTYQEMKKRVVDPRGRRYYSRRFAIGNEFGALAYVWASCTADAIDEAIDAGKLDSMRMSDADYLEYETNGWHDSYMLAGNASEPFWTEYLWATDITQMVSRP